jgi:hypothetical protein
MALPGLQSCRLVHRPGVAGRTGSSRERRAARDAGTCEGICDARRVAVGDPTVVSSSPTTMHVPPADSLDPARDHFTSTLRHFASAARYEPDRSLHELGDRQPPATGIASAAGSWRSQTRPVPCGPRSPARAPPRKARLRTGAPQACHAAEAHPPVPARGVRPQGVFLTSRDQDGRRDQARSEASRRPRHSIFRQDAAVPASSQSPPDRRDIGSDAR